MFESPRVAGLSLKHRQFQNGTQFLVLGDQKRHVLPSVWLHQPVEHEFVSLPPHKATVRGCGQLRADSVADCFNVSSCKCVQRHDAAVFQRWDFPPCVEGLGESG